MGTQITDIEETGQMNMEQYKFMPFIRIRTFKEKDIGNYKGFDQQAFEKYTIFEVTKYQNGENSRG